MPTIVAYTIRIAVDPGNLIPPPSKPGKGNFVYTPALLHVEAGDTIEWTCDQPFALTFKGGTPVDQVELFSQQGSTGAHTVRNVKGQFHYAVAVWKDDRVFIDAACASISVN